MGPYLPAATPLPLCSLVGVGYRAAVAGTTLTLNLGYSHPVEMPVPKGLEVKVRTGGRGDSQGCGPTLGWGGLYGGKGAEG